MNDLNTTVDELRAHVIDMCIRKGWGENGIQDPQHVAMAMTVEMSEVLEHFQWMKESDVQDLLAGKNEKKRQDIAEEIADVTCYLLQLTKSLGIDLTQEVIRKIAIVDKRQPAPDEPKR